MSRIPQITRVDFTDRDRTVITKVFSVASTLMLMRQGILPSIGDAEDLEFCHRNAEEVMAVLMKITRDAMNKDLLNLADGILSVEQKLVRENFDRIKRQMAAAKKANPEISARSALRKDMEWLVEELEKRI